MRKLFPGEKKNRIWPPEKLAGPWVAFVNRPITTREIQNANPGKPFFKVAAFDSRYRKEFYQWTGGYLNGQYDDEGNAVRVPYRRLFTGVCQICSSHRYVKVRGDFNLRPCPRCSARRQSS